MHKKFLKYLVCPQSGERLSIAKVHSAEGEDIIEGELTSTRCTYKITRGIPRFVPEANYADSFGMQWKKWPRVQFESENINSPMRGHTKNMFARILGPATEKDWHGKVVLDLGCGAGRFIEQARDLGATVIAVDYSLAADVARNNFAGDSDVCVIQADALSLPIADRVLNGAYSIGVLHHTPNPSRGFSEIVRTLSDSGWAAISLYGQGGHYDRAEVNLWRKFFGLIVPVLGYMPPLLYAYFCAYIVYPVSFVPLIGHILRAAFPMVRLPDLRWRILDTFDSVTPSHQSRHTPYELFCWYSKSGMVNVQPADWGVASMYGELPAACK